MRAALSFFVLLAMAGAAPATAEPLAPAYPETSRLDFSVLRDGSSLGTYTLRFEKRGDELHVAVDVDIEYRLAFVTLYRFEQDRNEIWRNGNLVELETRTNDDGDKYGLSVRAVADGLRVDGRDFKGVVPADTMPTGWWDIRTVERSELLDSEDGKLLKVSVETVGEETVQTWGKPVRATHYRVTGDTEKDLWYDENNVWVALKLTARDGSTITYRLEAPES